MNAATAPAQEKAPRKGERLLRTIVLTVQPMTRESFAPYGELISERGHIELDLDGGRASVFAQTVEAQRSSSISWVATSVPNRSSRRSAMRNPSSPSRRRAKKAQALPDVRRMAAFLVDGSCAFKLHRGTWHTSAFPLDERATFLVLDREGTLEEDYDLRDLKTALGVVVEIQR
jgi:ureidoglycolate lyase